MKNLIVALLVFNFIFANSLKDEESPYLLQHSTNPVNWYAWKKGAFERAKKENKLIFLSIGYSTCHWCHVMEKESFEDKEIAKILNKNFISIKVDKEEYPQIDRYYQLVYQILNKRGGGWPLTIIMTPDKEPIFAATYIPKESPNSTGLKEILIDIAKEWKNNPKRLKAFAHKVKLYADEFRYREFHLPPAKEQEALTKVFIKALESNFDKKYGGWGKNIKFPQASKILTLLDIYLLTKDETALNMATKTLDSMALSGLYDQIDGGFFRYSTDRKWQIPHFEKMLYTNAELIEVYLRAWEITKKPLYKKVAIETIELFLKRYKDKSGLFFGASDADTLNPKTKEKEEGYYFTYSFDEVKSFLESKGIDKDLINRGLNHYGISKGGNFINFKSNPYIANESGSYPVIKKALKELRENRSYPFIDKKMQTSWNSLMIHSLFLASKIDKSYGLIAKKALDTLLKRLYIDGKLYHQILPKKSPKVEAGLEDYAFLIEALIDAYDESMQSEYLNLAKELIKKAKELFFDKEKGVWLDSKSIISNPAEISDSAYKSALATLIIDYLRIGSISEDLKFIKEAKDSLSKYYPSIVVYPTSSSTAIRAYLAYKYGIILIKSNPKNMPKIKSKIINLYPFFEFKADKSCKFFQACKVDRCFVYEKNLNDFLQKLKKALSK